VPGKRKTQRLELEEWLVLDEPSIPAEALEACNFCSVCLNRDARLPVVNKHLSFQQAVKSDGFIWIDRSDTIVPRLK